MVWCVMSVKISVIMPVYNAEKFLKEAIESILNQTYSNFEFIIVDDCSIDSSVEIIKSYFYDQRIKYIGNSSNVGPTASRNKAIQIAQGEYIACQDADDISLPIRFEEQIGYFEKNKDIVLIGSSAYVIDEYGKQLWIYHVHKNVTSSIQKSNQFISGTVIFKKNIIYNVGYLNELYKYSGDYEYWLRVSKSYTVSNITVPLYKLRRNQSNNIGSKNKVEQTLYFLLAKKNTNGNSTELIEVIKTNGILSLYNYLNDDEKLYYHKVVARNYLLQDNINALRMECKKMMENDHYTDALILYILSYFGRERILKIYKLLRSLRGILVK